ncbi:SPA1-related 3 isoform 1 [Hibiscus syriacus]|uniref:SPA1-related 3 isoform 1 n=1 Tax=Hibiscus syriacus TaxID=106335 RepID=A0A6A2YY99_HIBSY|nr:SPA1-related 3 isoform 1 [Hibiscus syriacus]
MLGLYFVLNDVFRKSRGVLHRHIKGSNLLIDKNGILKIADFGLASFYDPHQSQPLTGRVVTLWYRPPELLLGATNYGTAVDLWSTGCILAELYAGKPIMPGRTEKGPRPDLERKATKESRAVPAPDANAELVFVNAGPLAHRAAREKSVENLDDAPKISTRADLSMMSGLVAPRSSLTSDDSREKSVFSQSKAPKMIARFPGSSESSSEQDPRHNDQQKDGRNNNKDPVLLGYGSKGQKIHYSGPLLVPSGTMDQMLKDHDRQIQEARIKTTIVKTIAANGSAVGSRAKIRSMLLGDVSCIG